MNGTYFNRKCFNQNSKHIYLKIKIMKQVFPKTSKIYIEEALCERGKCWLAQLFTSIYGNNSNHIYSKKRRGCRK